MGRKAILAGLMACAWTMPALAQSDEAKRFGAREHVEQMSLSPDGLHFAAVVAGKGMSSQLLVVPVDGAGAARGVMSAKGGTEQFGYCRWASNVRIICDVVGHTGKGRELLGYSRLVSFNMDGTDLKLVTVRDSSNALGIRQNGGSIIDWLPDSDAAGVLITRQFVPEVTTGTSLAETRSGMGVERVDPTSLKRTVLEQPRTEAREYITDGHGNVRVMGSRGRDGNGYDSRKISYYYRPKDSRSWQPLSTVVSDGQTSVGFNPYAVDATQNVVYGFEAKNGRQALFKIALDGTAKKELVFDRPDVDVDGLVRIGRQRRVVGVSYATDKRETAFFDPELKRLGASLSKALPGSPLISFVDASADEKKLLIWAGSDDDPGVFHVYDKTNHHLDALTVVRPELSGVKLAKVKAITYTAADGTPVPAYLTLPPGSSGKNLPAIVMPHGGPSARDEWGFDWLPQFFAARGYAVIQPNYRGSSGFGDSWFQNNGFKSWRTAIGDVNDAGRWLVKQGIAAPGKLAIVGWSYGGYAALQSSVLDADLFKAIVAVAPVTDLQTLRSEHTDYSDFNMVNAFIGTGAHVREGSPAQHADAIKAPVLLFHGDQDQNVGIGESRLMANRLRGAGKKVELIEFPGLDHQLDDSEARTKLLDKSDAFLRAAMRM